MLNLHLLQTSKPISSEEGKKLGLIDAIVSPEELLKVSRLWALEIAERRKPWVRSLHITEKLGSDAREVLATARQHVKKTASHLPQQQACIDVIEHGIIHGGYSGVLRVLLVLYHCFCSEAYACSFFFF
jgi:enoyl-CoA hydratase/3-hydroxyacyl-CoA dehydrogenase